MGAEVAAVPPLLKVILDCYRSAGPMEPSPVDIYLALAPLIAERVEAAKAEALREAADKWQWGEWTVLTAPIKAVSQPQRIIGAAQAVTDWLRDRAVRIGDPDA